MTVAARCAPALLGRRAKTRTSGTRRSSACSRCCARRPVLRFDVPPARHQPRRAPRLPRRRRRPLRLHGACSPRCGGRPGAATSTRRTAIAAVEGGRGRRQTRRFEDPEGARAPDQGTIRAGDAHEAEAGDRRRDRPALARGEPPPERPFATLGIASSTDYLLDADGLKSFQYSDRTHNFFWHHPHYAAVQICLAPCRRTSPPTEPCDPLKPTHYSDPQHDYGSVRKPVVFYWSVLVALLRALAARPALVGEDERARKRAALAPVPAPSE